MKNAVVVILTFVALSCFAQKDLRPGYIITNTDTIHGLIKYREGRSSLDKCSFYKTQDDEGTNYSAKELVAFGYQKRHFRSVAVKGKKQFAEVIVDGVAKLLRSRETYYIQKDTAVVSLEVIPVIAYVNGKRYQSEDKRYLFRLGTLFNDCSDQKFNKDLMEARVTGSGLEERFTDLVTRYNVCVSGKSAHYTVARSKSSVSWGVSASVASNSLKVTSTNTFLQRADFSPKLQPSAGIFVNYFHPRLSERFHFRVELWYQSVAAEGTTGNYRYDLSYNALQIPVSVSYRFGTGKVAPYIRAGFSYSAKVSGKLEQHRTAGGKDQISEPFDLAPKFLSLFGGAGVEKRFGSENYMFAEIRYSNSTNMLDNYIEHEINLQPLSLNIGVRF